MAGRYTRRAPTATRTRALAESGSQGAVVGDSSSRSAAAFARRAAASARRIAAARAYLASFQPDDFVLAADRAITFKAGPSDMILPGAEFLSFYALPQFYFHLTTAYDILRMQGVELGKRDYMGAV